MTSETIFELLRACQKGEAGSIVGRDIEEPPQLDDLYVPTKEDGEINELFVSEYETDGKLIILTGSAGDGKSALLANAYRDAVADSSVKINKEQFHLDATGSGYLQRSYKYDLTEFLDQAVSEMGTNAPRKGLAINYGLAIDYFQQENMEDRKGYQTVWKALDKAETERRIDRDNVVVINLGHRNLFEISPDTFGDGVLRKLIDHFDTSDDTSPIRGRADPTTADCPAGDRCPLHYNLEQLSIDEVRDKLTRLIAASCVIREQYINPRSVLDQLSRILLAPELRSLPSKTDECAVGRAIVRNNLAPRADHLLFNRAMTVLTGEYSGRFFDPTAQASAEIDQQALTWDADGEALNQVTYSMPLVDDEWTKTEQIRTAIRYQYFHGQVGETHIDRELFDTFLGGLSYFNGENTYESDGESVIETAISALQNWTGQSRDDDQMAFVDGLRSTEYRFTARWKKPIVDGVSSREQTKAQTRPGQLRLYFEHPDDGESIFVPLGYRLFSLMDRVTQGYNPSSGDLERSQGVRLLYSQLSQFTDKRQNVNVHDKTGDELFSVTKSALGSIKVRQSGDSP